MFSESAISSGFLHFDPFLRQALKLLVPEEHQPMAVSTLGFASRGGAILGMCFFGVRHGKGQLVWEKRKISAETW